MDDPLSQLLIEEEKRGLQPYYDSKGFCTVGVGHLVDPRRICPMPASIVEALFQADMAEKRALALRVPGYERLNEVQRAVLVSMIFQMGFDPFDGDGHRDFTKFLACLAAGDVVGARLQMLDSKWARTDSPKRALREANMMGSGLWVPRSA